MTAARSPRVFALLGDPVAHSLSPRLQNAAFRATGLDAVYVALRPAAADVAAVMATLVRDGGGGNVTIPFKPVAAAAAPCRGPVVEQLGSANVFAAGPHGEVCTANTDVDGILAAIDQLGAGAARHWGVVGTGGSARAVAGAAQRRGAALVVRSRDPGRHRDFVAWAAGLGVTPTDWSDCELIINATPLGLVDADRLPASLDDLPAQAKALDLVYRRNGTTPWVRAMQRAGRAVADGREVLLAQGAASWRYWFPTLPPPVEIMRAALRDAVD